MTTELNLSDNKKLRDVSAFIKNDEFFQILKKGGKKGFGRVQCVADEVIVLYLSEDVNFFQNLGHNKETKLPSTVQQNLKSYFKALENKYEKPSFFQLTVLHPYVAELELYVNGHLRSQPMGFADTKNFVTTAFVYDTIPFMKTMERMTNPCFQEKPFAKVMKHKHVANDFNDLDQESTCIGESGVHDTVSEKGDDTPSVPLTDIIHDNVGENVEANPYHPELSQLPQPSKPKSRGKVVESGRIVSRRSTRTRRK
jgi:hypothetical protein